MIFYIIADDGDFIPKRRSKISMQLDELKKKMKEQEEFLQELEDDFEVDINEDSNLFQKFKKNSDFEEFENFGEKLVKYNICFHLFMQGNEFVFNIKSDVFNKNIHHIYELIENIVKKINEKNIVINFKKVNYIVSLKDCDDLVDKNDKKQFYMDNYELKQYENKNNKSEKDLQRFGSKSSLKDLNDNEIIFTSKNPINILIREKFEKNKEEGNDKYKFLFDDY